MIFKKPEKLMYQVLLLVFIIAFSVLVIVQNNWMFLVIPLFVLVWMWSPVVLVPSGTKKHFWVFMGVFLAADFVTEVLAIMQNIFGNATEGALFSTNPVLDLLLAVLYYVPIGVLVYRAFVRTPFSTRLVFVTSGVFGVLTEQFFRVFLSFNLLFWVVVFVLYGSFFTLPYVIYKESFDDVTRDVEPKVTLNAFLYLLGHYIMGYVIAFTLFVLYKVLT